MTATLTGRELIEERRALDGFLAEAEGELTPELQALLDDVTVSLKAKVEATARFVASELARMEAIIAEERRLLARRKAIEHRVTHLKNVLLRELLEAMGVEEVRGALHSVSIQANPPAVVGELDEEALRTLAVIDPSLVRHTETWALDRKAALKAHLAGAPLPVGLSIERKTSVRIR